MRSARLARSASTVSNSEASEAHSSVTSGRTFSLTAFTSTRNWRSPLLVGVGVGGPELEDVADLRAGELLVDLRGDRAGADGVAVVVGGEARTAARRRACRRCRS